MNSDLVENYSANYVDRLLFSVECRVVGAESQERGRGRDGYSGASALTLLWQHSEAEVVALSGPSHSQHTTEHIASQTPQVGALPEAELATRPLPPGKRHEERSVGTVDCGHSVCTVTSQGHLTRTGFSGS